MKFELTEQAKLIAIQHLANDGWLDLCLTRVEEDGFIVSGQHNGEDVIKISKTYYIPSGSNTLTLTGIKMKFDLE